MKLVTFQLGLDLFGADVLSVDRVLRYSPPNAVPDVPTWIQGVLEHRGNVIPVVDLRRRVELSDDSITPETRMLVFKAQDGYVCAVVDMVHEVSEVPTSSIAPPPPLFRGLSAEFIRGIAKMKNQLIVILDVDRVLTSTDRIKFDQSAHAEGAARD
jgi:purine-binding chemotaxis protein CheW